MISSNSTAYVCEPRQFFFLHLWLVEIATSCVNFDFNIYCIFRFRFITGQYKFHVITERIVSYCTIEIFQKNVLNFTLGAINWMRCASFTIEIFELILKFDRFISCSNDIWCVANTDPFVSSSKSKRNFSISRIFVFCFFALLLAKFHIPVGTGEKTLKTRAWTNAMIRAF